MGVSLVSAPQGTQGYSPVSTTNGSGEQVCVCWVDTDESIVCDDHQSY